MNSDQKRNQMKLEISFAKFVQTLWDGQIWIESITVLFSAIGLAYVFWITTDFHTETTIMPPQLQQFAVAALCSAGIGIVAVFGIKYLNDIYGAMIKSNRVVDFIVVKFQLHKNMGLI